MIFAKSTCSIKMRKKLDFGLIFGGPNDEHSITNRLQRCVVFQYRILSFFSSILAPFRGPKILEKSIIFEKIEVRRRLLKR